MLRSHATTFVPSSLLLLYFLLFASHCFAATHDCRTHDYWTQEVQRMNAHLDDSIQPCDNFYKYACGKWRVSSELRALHARDTLTALKASNKQLLLHHLELDATNESARLSISEGQSKLQTFYASCLDDARQATAARQQQQRQRKQWQRNRMRIYRELLLSINDNWPLLNAQRHLNSSFDWRAVCGRLRHYGAHGFWQLLVEPREGRWIFHMSPLSNERWLNVGDRDDENLFLYKRYIKNLLLALDVRVRQAIRIADELLDFESALHALHSNTSSNDDFVLQSPQTLHSLQHELRTLNLSVYFAQLVGEEVVAAQPNYAQHLLIVVDRNYLQRLAILLAQTKTQTLSNFLLVQFLTHFAVLRHEDVDNIDEQRQNCLLQLNNLLPQQLTQLYLELRHDSEATRLQQTRHEVQLLFEELKQQFERMLNGSNIFYGVAASDRMLALDKLRAMRLLLPLVPTSMQSHNHSDSEMLMTSDYNANLLQLAKSHAAQELAPILRTLSPMRRATATASQPRQQHQYGGGALDVNAYYRLRKNAIELPLGLLHAPVYDRCLASVLPRIYGSLGYILAHEMLHAFDYDGINFDETGRVANAWSAKTIIRFGSRAACYLSARYSNAALNINENMADSEGLRLALNALKRSRSSSSDSSSGSNSDSNNATQLQLFFKSFAQLWCGTEATHSRSLHATHKQRINNAVANFDEFAEAFNCRAGVAVADSDASATRQCSIWHQNE